MLCIWAIRVLALATGLRAPAELPQGRKPADDLVGIDPGPIAITCPSKPAQFSFSMGKGKIESAGEGAGRAARDLMTTPSLGNAELEAAVGAVEFVLTPFAAGYGALTSARMKMSSEQLAKAGRDVAEAMGTMAEQEHLRQAVFECGSQKTHRRLISMGPATAMGSNSPVASAWIETRVEELRLEHSGSGDSKFSLRIQARARLVRASNGAVLWDRPYAYHSGDGMFIDWTRYDGLASVARTGYRQIGEDIARDFLEASAEEPIVLRPARKSASARTASMSGERPVALAHGVEGPGANRGVLSGSSPAPTRPPSLEERGAESWAAASSSAALGSVSPVEERAGRSSMVSTSPETSSMSHSFVRPQPGSPSSQSQSADEDVPQVRSDTESAMDGLEDDQNAVVQAAASLAAAPFGLWEHTVGAVGEGSRKRFEAVNSRLQDVVRELKPERILASELVKLLEPLTSEPVGAPRAPIVAGSQSEAAVHAGSEPEALVIDRADPQGVLVRAGAGAAVEIQGTDVELERKSGLRARVSLRLEARATLVRLRDGQELFSLPLRFVGVERRLEDWSAEARSSYRAELRQGCREMAGVAARELVSRGFVRPGAGSLANDNGSPVNKTAPR